MARKKQGLNKNLVAGLTAFIIVGCAGAVFLITPQLSKRPPDFWAVRARNAISTGDTRRGQQLFLRAFQVEKETKYLVEAADAMYETGQIGDAITLLRQAHAQDARSVPVLEALVGRLWALRSYIPLWTDLRDLSQELIELDPKNVLGLTTRSAALSQLAAQDPSYPELAEEAMRAATEIAPTDPRVVYVLAERKLLAARDLAVQAGRRVDDATRAQIDALCEAAIEILKRGIADNPADEDLVGAAANQYVALQRWDECEALYLAAIAANPKTVELRSQFAAMLYERARQDETLSDDQKQQLLGRSITRAQEATQLDKAEYAAWLYAAKAQKRLWELSGEWESDRIALQKQLLDGLRDAVEETRHMETLTAQLGRGDLLSLLFEAFDLAIKGAVESSGADRAYAMERSEGFLDEVRREFPGHLYSHMLEGRLLILKEDVDGSIAAFRAAAEQSADQPLFNADANEKLSYLYKRKGQEGIALECGQKAIDGKIALGIKPSHDLLAHFGQLLVLLKKPTEALEFVVRFADDPEHIDFLRIQADAYRQLNRQDQLNAVVAKINSKLGSDEASLLRARLAMVQQKWDEALVELESLLEKSPENTNLLRTYCSVLISADRKGDGVAFLDRHKERVTDPKVLRFIEAQRIAMSAEDQDAVVDQLLEMIGDNPDPVARAVETYNVCLAAGRNERAAAALDELEAAFPDEMPIVEQQFNVRLRLKQYDRAREYANKLVAADFDRVGGATFLGELAMSQGDAETALKQFRLAEQKFPTDYQAKIRVARALLLARRVDEARIVLQAAIDLDPGEFSAHRLLYLAYNALGETELAEEELAVAAEINPDDPFIKERSDLLEERANPRAGIAKREAKMKEAPDDIENMLRLASLYMAVGDLDKAAERAVAAFEKAPGDRAALQVNLQIIIEQMSRAEIAARGAIVDRAVAMAERYMEASDLAGKIAGKLTLATFYQAIGGGRLVDPSAAFTAMRGYLEEIIRDADQLADADQRGAAKRDAQMRLVLFYDQLMGDQAAALEATRVALGFAEPGTPQAADVRFRIITYLLKLKRFDELDTEVSEFRKLFPQDPRGMIARAQYYVFKPGSVADERERLEKALEELNLAIRLNDRDSGTMQLRGQVLGNLQRYSEALDDLRRAERLASNPRAKLSIRNNIHEVYRDSGQIELAEAELRAILKDFNSPQEYVQKLVDFYVANGKSDAAKTFLTERIAKDGSNPILYYQLGRLHARDRQFVAAIPHYRKAFEITAALKHPEGQALATQMLASLLETMLQADRAAEAAKTYADAGPLGRNPITRTWGAEAMYKAGDVEGAMREFRAAVKAAAEGAQFAVVSGRVSKALGAARAAEVFSTVADEMDDPQIKARLRVAVANAWFSGPSEDDARRGLEVINQVLAGLDKTDGVRVEALFVRAQLLERVGDAEGARKDYETLLEHNAENVFVLNNLAFLLADKLDRPEEARAYAEQLRLLGADNPMVLDTIGWVYFRLGEVEEAERIFRTALRIQADALAPRWHLARVLIASNRAGQARKELERLRDDARKVEDNAYITQAEEALRNLR